MGQWHLRAHRTQSTRQCMRMERFTSILALMAGTAMACTMQPVSSDQFDNTIVTLYDTRFGDGINAGSYDANAGTPGQVNHGRCSNDQPSACNWQIIYCGDSGSQYDNAPTFALQSQYYPGTFLSAGYSVDVENAPTMNPCTATNTLKWIVYYAECNDRYYFMNFGYGTWMYAVNFGNVHHGSCPVTNPLDTDCGCDSGREMYFMNL